MDDQGRFAASLIDASARAFAAAAVTRYAEGDAAGADAVEAWGFTRLVDDVQGRLGTLAEALAVDDATLLELDLAWFAAACAVREVPLDTLRGALRELAGELRDGLPGAAAGRAAAFLEKGLTALEGPAPAVPGVLVHGAPHVELATALVGALLEGRRRSAEKLLLRAFDNGVDVVDLHEHVIVAAQREMGRMWQLGEIHVADEHLGSRIVESVLSLLRHRVAPIATRDHTVMVASVKGNLHDIGAQLVSDQLEFAGYRSLFLGANTPAPDMALAVDHYAVDLLAVSAGVGLHVRTTAHLIATVRAGRPELPILVGGGPFNLVPDLWRKVGADGWARSARTAVEEVGRLLDAES